MQVLTDKIQVGVVVVCETKCFFERLASLQGKPNLWDGGIDIGVYSSRKKILVGPTVIGAGNLLNCDDKVAFVVRSEIEGDIVWDEARGVVATKR